MKWKPLAFTLAAVCLAAVCLTACAQEGTPLDQRQLRARANTGEIVIGSAWPWALRKNLLFAQGLDMALDEINSRGGVHGRRLRIVKEDDQETVDLGRAAAQRLTAKPELVAVIGHLQSFMTVPAAAIYDMAGVLLIAPTSTDPALTEQGYKFVFRTTFTDRQVGRHMALLARSRGYRRIAIYYMRDRYGRSLANAFEETFTSEGGLVVDRQSYDASDSNNPRQLGQLVHDWKQRDLQAIFIAGEALQASLVMAEAKTRGLNVAVLGGDALGTPELFGAGPDAAEGATLVSVFHPDDPRPEVRQFVGAFKKRFGREPDTAAALAYDSLHLLAAAMAQAPSTAPVDIARALHAISGWRGVTGTLSFSETGDLNTRPLLTVTARKGRFAFLSNGDAPERPSLSAADEQ
jgi:branched-chain amino acid transport system substrate-binding protein